MDCFVDDTTDTCAVDGPGGTCGIPSCLSDMVQYCSEDHEGHKILSTGRLTAFWTNPIAAPPPSTPSRILGGDGLTRVAVQSVSGHSLLRGSGTRWYAIGCISSPALDVSAGIMDRWSIRDHSDDNSKSIAVIVIGIISLKSSCQGRSDDKNNDNGGVGSKPRSSPRELRPGKHRGGETPLQQFG